jgi:SAM-dependent methyltransferase
VIGSVKIIKLKLAPWLFKLAYKFVDIEASPDTAVNDGRMIEYAWVLEKLSNVNKGRVLDVGCTAGHNYLPAALIALGWDVWGLDIREFKFRHERFNFILDDIIRIKTHADYFDAVYAASTLEHLGLTGRYGISQLNMKADKMAVDNIAKLLKPKGKLICTLPYSRVCKVIQPFQRIYDRESIVNLFTNWIIQDSIIYCLAADRYWTPIAQDEVNLLSDEKECLILLELIYNQNI